MDVLGTWALQCVCEGTQSRSLYRDATLTLFMFTHMLPSWLAGPVLIGLATALPVGVGAWMMARYEAASERIRFEQAASQAAQSLVLRLHECDTRLLALATWLDGSGPSVDNADWLRMDARLRLSVPGTCTGPVAFMPMLASKDLAAYEAAQSARLGYAYQVFPTGPRPWYAPLLLIAPVSPQTRRVLGMDPASDPKRRSVLERARDTGRPAATGRVHLQMSNDPLRALILHAPVYRQGLPLDTVDQRRAALFGFVGQPLFVDTALSTTAAEHPSLQLDLIDPLEEADAAQPVAASDVLEHPFLFGERGWLLRARPVLAPASMSAWRASTVWLLAGLLLALLAAAASVLIRQRTLAHHLTRRIGDISREQELLAQTAQAEQLNRLLLDAVPSALVLVDREGLVRRCNPAACHLLACDENALIGLPLAQLHEADETPHPPKGPAPPQALRSQRGPGGQLIEVEWLIRHRDGEHVPVAMLAVAVNASPSAGRPEQADSTLVQLTDISERKRATAQIERLALHDSLTGLPNRAQLEERAQRALQHAQQHDKGLALVLMDLDRFKQVNDTLGHSVGDHLLQNVARGLSEAVRSGDTVARMGGDEFVLLLVDVGTPTEAMHVVEKIRDTFRTTELRVDGHLLRVAFSVGVALFPTHGSDLASLLRQADLAMYRAKASGRNTALLYDPARHAIQAAGPHLEADLRRALSAGELRLHYQPVVHAATGRIAGLEALLRWQHPTLGLIPPADFLGLAEHNGEIVPIGAWTLRQACADLARLRAQWPALRVAVNLSAHQLLSHELVHDVHTALQQAGLPGSALDLEITESALLQTQGQVLNTLTALRALGVGITIEDFGTGPSSLASLSNAPVTTLKVDRDFVSQIGSGLGVGTLPAAIVALAHGLGLQTVAEGAETSAQWAALRHSGCEQLQGYLFSPAVPMDRLPDTLARLASLSVPERMS